MCFVTVAPFLCMRLETFVPSEYDALSRIGINDPREYISQHYCTMSGSGELVQLSTCCVGKAVVTRVEGALEEMLGSGGWFDSMVSV